jgi:ABC transport system ATP-binding/permease protein
MLSDEKTIKKWYAKWRNDNPGQPGTQPAQSKQNKELSESPFKQWYWLSRRYLNIKLNDQVNTILLISQPLIIAGLVAIIFKDLQLGVLFLMAISAIWFGVSNAAKEIVGEMPIYKRERMFNLRILTYLLSKVTVLTFFAIIQVTLFVGIIYLCYHNQTPSLGFYYHNALFMLYLSFSATLMGLLLSAVFDNTEKVMSVVPIALMPQIMLAGVVTKLSDKVIEGLSYMTLGRWGTEGFALLQDQVSGVTSQVPSPTGEKYVKAMNILDFYNDNLMGVSKSDTLENVVIAISIINLVVFIALCWALKRKDSIK